MGHGELRAGRLVDGKFRVVDLLGEGGMGWVYRAVQEPLDRPVALKLLRPQRTAEGAVNRERFLREARLASNLRHPGLAMIYDYGQWGEELYLAMELLEGGSLADQLTRRPRLPGEEAAEILIQVCRVLELTHDRGVLHRDLKPENLMFSQDAAGAEQVKVVDFGLALLLDPGVERLTQDDMVSGTPAYMAPEQCRGRGADLDGRADIYALGVMLYELLCGRQPFMDEQPSQVLLMHLYRDPRPPSEVCPEAGIHPALEALALWAMAKAPDDRPASALDLRLELEAALTLMRQEAQGPARATPAPAPQPRAPAAGEVLVIEAEDPPFASSLTATLRARGFAVDSGSQISRVLELSPQADVCPQVVVDLTPDPEGILDQLQQLTEANPRCRGCVVAVGPEEIQCMSRALQLGIGDYVPSSLVVERLPRALKRIKKRQQRENKAC